MRETFLWLFSMAVLLALLSCGRQDSPIDPMEMDAERFGLTSGELTLKIMTFNVLGGDLCRDMVPDLRAIAHYIKNQKIVVSALQEAISQNEKDCEGFDMVEIMRDELTRIAPEYRVTERQYIKSGLNGLNRKWYRVFVHALPIASKTFTASTSPEENQGVEAIVLETGLGKIRFINLHPAPGEQALRLDKTLLPFLDSLRGDGIPMVLMGDFNLSTQFSDSAPVLQRIADAGFHRACNPKRFPNASCNDTVTSSAPDHAVDHIFVDNRAEFSTVNSYVERNLTFSDHFPLVAEIALSRIQQIIANGRYWTLDVDNGYRPINPGGAGGTNLHSNSVYASGPCKGKGSSCNFDAFAVGVVKHGTADKRVQQIVADGRYWTLDIDNGYIAINPGGISGTPLLANGLFAEGPCRDHQKDCQFDAMAIGALKQGNKDVRVQQIIAYGKYWTLDIDNGYNAINPGGIAGTPLKSNSFYANGPCANHQADCRIDSLAIGTLNQGSRVIRVQQIVAYGKYWTLDIDDGYKAINPGGMAGMALSANSFYASGPCLDQLAQCSLDDMGLAILQNR